MAKSNLFIYENISKGLIAAADEMFISWGRTSQSTIIYEVLDYACGITDPEANLIAQADGVTGFLGAITYSVKSTIDKFGLENIAEGDIILTNDPYTGSGTHLCDVSAVMPIYYQGEIIAFCCNKGHWNEIGGKNLGSWSTDATEIYQEGLQFPIVKVYQAGKLNEAVRDMIAANCRTPRMTLGDLYAQTASLKVAAKRVIELFDKYGVKTVQETIAYMLEKGKEHALNQLKKLTKGTFTAEGLLDLNSNGVGEVPVKATVTIKEDEFIIDLSGTGGQVNQPINCSIYGTHAAARVVFGALVDPDAQINEGFYAPLTLKVPEGTVVSCTRPYPVSCDWEPIAKTVDVVMKAVAPVIAEKSAAGHFLSIVGTILAGQHDQSGEPFVLCEPQAGGWGGTYYKDGESGMVAILDGETYNIPVEIAEMRYPIIVEQYSLNLEAGSGKHRGGFGCIRDYRLLNSQAALTTLATNHTYPTWGFAGGKDGGTNRVDLYYSNGEYRPGGTWSNELLQKGDLVRFITGGGGGYGNPLERDPELVLNDYLDGYLTVEQSAREYGVVIDPAKKSYDADKTAQLRNKR